MKNLFKKGGEKCEEQQILDSHLSYSTLYNALYDSPLCLLTYRIEKELQALYTIISTMLGTWWVLKNIEYYGWRVLWCLIMVCSLLCMVYVILNWPQPACPASSPTIVSSHYCSSHIPTFLIYLSSQSSPFICHYPSNLKQNHIYTVKQKSS